MANFPFGRFREETEVRKPSKAFLIFSILFLLLLILSATFIALYIVEKTKSTDSSSGTCATPTCITSAADILNKLDKSADPCEDFYQYSCGGFLEKTHIPDGKLLVNSFTRARDFIDYSLKEILQNDKLMSNYTKDSAVHKGFMFYKSCMNETAIEKLGIKGILDVIEQHGSCNMTKRNWTEESWVLEKYLARAFVDLNVQAFISLSVRRSFLNASQIYITVSGGKSGLQNLLEREKSNQDDPTKHLETKVDDDYKKYKKFVSTIFKLLRSNSNITEEVNRIVDLEKKFKEIKETQDWYDTASLKKNIKFMTIDELTKFTSSKFNWRMYFAEMLNGTGVSLPPNIKLMIVLPDNIKKIVDWMTNKPKSLLANEMIWYVVHSVINLLPRAFREAQDEYIFGSTGVSKRWRTCNGITDFAFPYVTTLLYANEHLKDETKEAAGKMLKEVKKQFTEGLKEQDWMDDATRAQALLKLQQMTDLIGYYSFINDPVRLNLKYKNVQVDDAHLLQNTLSVLKDQFIQKLSRLGGGVNSDRAMLTSSLRVNAMYVATYNWIHILVGILQQPFYVGDGLKALNYGSLGMVAGHEITHGFDKYGSEYDGKGNLRDWWTKASRENFVKRSTCLVNQYSKVEIFGYKVDGNNTLSENIADNGGLKYSFRAYQKWRDIHGNEDKLPGLSFNNDQLFFIGFAQTWCAKYTEEGVKRLIKDVHSLNPLRVRIPTSNFPEFNKAFGCTPKNDTCTFW